MKEYRATKEHPFHISCGGIVCKNSKDGVKILLLHRFKSEKWPFDSWHLPKGTKRTGESDRQTVEREVTEETGYQVEVLKKIGSLKSQYYEQTRLTVGGEPAVKLAVPDPNSSEPISVYIQHKNYIYRLVWGDSTDEFGQNRKLFEKIMQTLTFTD